MTDHTAADADAAHARNIRAAHRRQIIAAAAVAAVDSSRARTAVGHDQKQDRDRLDPQQPPPGAPKPAITTTDLRRTVNVALAHARIGGGAHARPVLAAHQPGSVGDHQTIDRSVRSCGGTPTVGGWAHIRPAVDMSDHTAVMRLAAAVVARLGAKPPPARPDGDPHPRTTTPPQAGRLV